MRGGGTRFPGPGTRGVFASGWIDGAGNGPVNRAISIAMFRVGNGIYAVVLLPWLFRLFGALVTAQNSIPNCGLRSIGTVKAHSSRGISITVPV
jgi:hypothetical protein